MRALNEEDIQSPFQNGDKGAHRIVGRYRFSLDGLHAQRDFFFASRARGVLQAGDRDLVDTVGDDDPLARDGDRVVVNEHVNGDSLLREPSRKERAGHDHVVLDRDGCRDVKILDGDVAVPAADGLLTKGDCDDRNAPAFQLAGRGLRREAGVVRAVGKEEDRRDTAAALAFGSLNDRRSDRGFAADGTGRIGRRVFLEILVEPVVPHRELFADLLAELPGLGDGFSRGVPAALAIHRVLHLHACRVVNQKDKARGLLGLFLVDNRRTNRREEAKKDRREAEAKREVSPNSGGRFHPVRIGPDGDAGHGGPEQHYHEPGTDRIETQADHGSLSPSKKSTPSISRRCI